MFLITSAAYITPGLASEFGKLPPCMLPVQNKRLYEHQFALVPKGESIVLTLPKSYTLTAYDKKRLCGLGVQVVFAPDAFSLGQSIVYALNVVGKYNKSIAILHGDTLFSELTVNNNVCSVAKAEYNYEWASANQLDKTVYSGFFSFSDQSLIIRAITECEYNFIRGVEEYAKVQNIAFMELPNWMDLSLVNSYYRSISKMTTQRVFNSMKVSQYSVRKSSMDKRKMEAESNWIVSLPISMKHYAPSVWDRGEDGNKGFYEIEYYFLSSLASIFVFGKTKPYVWEEIINACVEFLNDEISYKPQYAEEIVCQNNQLYAVKTLKRMLEYSKQSGVSLEKPWRINGVHVPSINQIVAETESLISKQDSRFVTLMHGDLCFSNILYDFKSKSIKVIDPRGVNVEGELSIYGDFRYDVGKLAHSILGMYDFIIGGMFEYSEQSQYDVKLSFEINNELKQVQDYFLNQCFGGYSITELSTYPIMIHLFLSMLPLHDDNKLRQKAMLANALRLYVELKK